MWCLPILFFVFYLAAAEEAVQEFTTANNLFTRGVYKEVTKTEGNFLVSPFSIEAVLAFAQSGSKGESAEELRTALHLPNDKSKVETAVKSILPKLRSNDLYTLYTASKIYVKKNFTIKDEFKNAASTVYQADSESIDFAEKSEAANNINSWVEKHTNSKIQNLISADDLDERTRAILINALYFKANWSNPFRLVNSGKRNFYKTPTDAVEMKTLNYFDEVFKYYECPHLEAKFLELPFKGDEASMVIVLPNKKDGLSALEPQLDQVFSPQHELTPTLLHVTIPKFKIESSLDLKKILVALGVNKIFDEEKADLSGISGEPGDLFIKKVVQKTFIDVSEEGVEAAAATLVLVAVPVSAPLREPKVFVADHPFIFYNKVKDLIIFAGRVIDPSNH